MSIRVLVVDDSALARMVLLQIFGASHGIEVVGTARDGLDAIEKIRTLSPDVITLDLAMPHLDGLGVLAAIAAPGAPRVVVVSNASDDDHTVVAALQAGAISSVHKPSGGSVTEMAEELVEAVRHASVARWTTPTPMAAPTTTGPVGSGRTRMVVVGASSGGPQALTGLLMALPATFPVPICVVLHMPVGYTETFARRLNDQCALDVKEAEEGLPLRAGLVIVARAGVHLSIGPGLGRPAARLSSLPNDRPHRPSVDVLFSSAAKCAGAAVLGVVLTGMGDDGLVGSRAIVDAGGRVITQSAASCVVYGMPRCVAEAGLSDEAVHLAEIPGAILDRL